MAGETTLAESAQAIFCSMADYLGASKSEKILNLKLYPKFDDFLSNSKNKEFLDKALTRVKVDGNAKDVFEFLSKKDSWYQSSIIIANKIVKDLKEIDSNYNISQEGYSDGGMFYLRGNVDVMKDIGELFKLANTSPITKRLEKELPGFPGFKDINKWSPADIYFANKTSQSEIKKQLTLAKKSPYSFDILNQSITKMIDEGNLLPLSLKKTTKSASLVKVNFSDDIRNKLLNTVKFINTTNWKEYKRLDRTEELSWLKIKQGQKTETRDIRLMIDTGGGKGEIKLRHDPSGSSSGRLVIEFLGGGEARGGSIASHIALHNLWSAVDKSAADKFLKAYNDGLKEFSKIKKDKDKDKTTLRSDKYKNTSQYDHHMAIASAENITNNIMPIIKTWFNSNTDDKAQKLTRLMFQIATSRSPLSSRFVIAK